MIRNPNDIQDGAKKIRMLIAGYPGIGKSTLALSSPRPLHIDCDFGIDRIKDADTANAAMPPFKALQHHLTSRQELNAQWKAKIAALGLTFDTAAAQYKPAEEAQ